MKIFLTGKPGSGKSFIIMKIIEQLKTNGLKVGGIATPEVRVNGRRIAFKVVDIFSGEEGILASINQLTGPQIGKYRVNLDDFERVALPAVDFALKECDIICLDELGKMEFFSVKFEQKVNESLASQKSVIATVHRNYANLYEKLGTLFYVTPEKRKEILKTVISEILKGSRYFLLKG